jgi:NlpC/P60 family
MTSYPRALACALLLALLSTVGTAGAKAAPVLGAEDPSSPSGSPTADADSGPDLAAATDALQTDLTQMRAVQDEAQARYEEAKAKADKLRALVAQNEAAASQARLIVGQYARTIYMNGPTDISVLASMIDTDSPGDIMQLADDALRVGDHKDDQYKKAVELLKRNEEIKAAAESAELAAQASLQSVQNQMLGLRRQLADGVDAWAKQLAGETTLFNAEQAKANSDAAAGWAAYLGKLADWKVPSVTSQELSKHKLPSSLTQARNNPGVASFKDGNKGATVVPERVVAAVTYAVSKLGTAYKWQTSTETQMDCSSLVDRAWSIPSIPQAKRTDERDLVADGVSGVAAHTRLIPTAKLTIGDVVFLADDGRGVNHVGIVLDHDTMIAADSGTGAANALPIPKNRLWHAGRLSLAPPKKSNVLPRVTEREFQCGSDPRAFITLPDGKTLSNPDLCPPSAVFGELHMQDAAIRVGRCAAAIWPVLQVIGGWRPDDPYPDHPSGRATDIMMPQGCVQSPEKLALGNAIATFFMKNAKKFHVQYIIWQQRIWDAATGEAPAPPQQWRGMSNRGGCTANHQDHVHISVIGPNTAPGVPTPVAPAPQAQPSSGTAQGNKKSGKPNGGGNSGNGGNGNGSTGTVNPAPAQPPGEGDPGGSGKGGSATPQGRNDISTTKVPAAKQPVPAVPPAG